MKKIFLFFFLFLLSISIRAQLNLDVQVAPCSYPVIQPTIKNLISLVNMDVNTFKATMAKYKYHPDEDLAGAAYVYTNINLDFFLDNNNGKGVNTIIFDPVAGKYKYAGIWIETNLAYPRTCIQDFYQELAPYYRKTENDDRYYSFQYNDENYAIIAKVSDDRKTIVFQMYKGR